MLHAFWVGDSASCCVGFEVFAAELVSLTCLRTSCAVKRCTGVITLKSPYANHCVQVTQGTSELCSRIHAELQCRPLQASCSLGDQKEPPLQALEATVHTWAGLISRRPWEPDFRRTHFAPARCAATAKHCTYRTDGSEQALGSISTTALPATACVYKRSLKRVVFTVGIESQLRPPTFRGSGSS